MSARSRQMPAGELEAKCLSVLDNVQRTGRATSWSSPSGAQRYDCQLATADMLVIDSDLVRCVWD